MPASPSDHAPLRPLVLAPEDRLPLPLLLLLLLLLSRAAPVLDAVRPPLALPLVAGVHGRPSHMAASYTHPRARPRQMPRHALSVPCPPTFSRYWAAARVLYLSRIDMVGL
jgi:hypothetical protein